MTPTLPDPRSQFMAAVSAALAENSFQEIRLTKYRGPNGPRNIVISLTALSRRTVITVRHETATQHTTKHHDDPADVIGLINQALGTDFWCATLFGAKHELSLDYSKRGVPTLHKRKPAKPIEPAKPHDRQADRLITTELPYLHRLGICTAEGLVRPRMAHKLHQIQKFLEIVDSRIAASPLANKQELIIYDLGAGKSYLTFALYEYLTRSSERSIRLVAVEQRADLVAATTEHAAALKFHGLSSIQASICSAPLERADIIVALHACDTASDDAISRAVNIEAPLILLAPCCHRWLRGKMKTPAPFARAFRHGILEEQFAVICTEALRAAYLESHGYEVSVFEFIDREHTDKNGMIAATKRAAQGDAAPYEQLKASLGLPTYYLDAESKSVII